MKQKEEPEIACTLGERELAERREELRRGIVRRITDVRELTDGYSFALPDGDASEAEANAFAQFERECCSFASYDVSRDAADGRVWLTVTGPEGTKEFLRNMVPGGLQIQATAGGEAPNKSLRAGLAGSGAAAFALILCATPALPVVLGAAGLGGSFASVAGWIDTIAVPLLLLSVALVGFGVMRRRRSRAASTSASPATGGTSCGTSC